MAAGRSKGRDSAQERERARVYEARRRFHASVDQRRRRDNLIAGVAGGLLIVALLGAQVAYYTVGPGTPEPAPTPTAPASPSGTPSPDVSGSPTPSPSPSDTPTASPTP
ncbi:dioxygenase [Microbacterium oleivorans]|uniref:dioxygenase n=1 Tax=Microbacterium oleivorans TaxID=273677 RepID=UPI00203E8B8C|nr:dioxygenase [Microbacterium oleivorans]MCM3696675.1 dioxygenase [Microbacterium oleivorans]